MLDVPPLVLAVAVALTALAIGVLANWIPRPAGVRTWHVIIAILLLVGISVWISYEPADKRSQNGVPPAASSDLSEFRLPPSLLNSDDSERPGSDEGVDFLYRNGLIGIGGMFDARQYMFCTEVSADSSTCSAHIYYLANSIHIDLNKLRASYSVGLYEEGDYSCTRSATGGETLCRRQLGINLWLIVRFDANSGTGDDVNSWRFRDDARVRAAYIAEANRLVQTLVPTGRSVSVEPSIIEFANRSEEVRINVHGVRPDEYVDVEYGRAADAGTGGICPKLTTGPCTLYATGGGKASESGDLELILEWHPCVEAGPGRLKKALIGTYPIWIHSRDSKFTAATSFQVSVREEERGQELTC